GARIKIVYCVRDLADHAFSSWRQLVMYHNETLDWISYQSRYAENASRNGFEPTLRRFSGTMKPDEIIVIKYTRDISRRFFALFEEDYEKYQPVSDENVSEGNLVLDTMLKFNRMLEGKFEPRLSQLFREA